MVDFDRRKSKQRNSDPTDIACCNVSPVIIVLSTLKYNEFCQFWYYKEEFTFIVYFFYINRPYQSSFNSKTNQSLYSNGQKRVMIYQLSVSPDYVFFSNDSNRTRPIVQLYYKLIKKYQDLFLVVFALFSTSHLFNISLNINGKTQRVWHG